MIQRIQSVWLFLAAMANGLLFILPLYRYNTPGLAYSPWIIEKATNYSPLFLVAAVITILPLVTIFFFKDRKRQKGMIWLSIIGILGFLALMLMRVANLKNGAAPVTNMEYMIPGFLPTIIAIIFLFLAHNGIKKDEKLIKSLDRLR